MHPIQHFGRTAIDDKRNYELSAALRARDANEDLIDQLYLWQSQWGLDGGPDYISTPVARLDGLIAELRAGPLDPVVRDTLMVLAEFRVWRLAEFLERSRWPVPIGETTIPEGRPLLLEEEIADIKINGPIESRHLISFERLNELLAVLKERGVERDLIRTMAGWRFQWDPEDPNPLSAEALDVLIAYLRASPVDEVISDTLIALTEQRMWRLVRKYEKRRWRWVKPVEFRADHPDIPVRWALNLRPLELIQHAPIEEISDDTVAHLQKSGDYAAPTGAVPFYHRKIDYDGLVEGVFTVESRHFRAVVIPDDPTTFLTAERVAVHDAEVEKDRVPKSLAAWMIDPDWAWRGRDIPSAWADSYSISDDLDGWGGETPEGYHEPGDPGAETRSVHAMSAMFMDDLFLLVTHDHEACDCVFDPKEKDNGLFRKAVTKDEAVAAIEGADKNTKDWRYCWWSHPVLGDNSTGLVSSVKVRLAGSTVECLEGSALVREEFGSVNRFLQHAVKEALEKLHASEQSLEPLLF